MHSVILSMAYEEKLKHTTLLQRINERRNKLLNSIKRVATKYQSLFTRNEFPNNFLSFTGFGHSQHSLQTSRLQRKSKTLP